MLGMTIIASLILLSSLCVTDASIKRRQASQELLGQYIYQVRTAIYVIDSIQADNATSSCADSDLRGQLDSSGYDGEYAQRLLCEAAIGIQIFSDLDQASADMEDVLNGLDYLQKDEGSSNERVCDVRKVDTLDEAGLDGPGIQNVLCATNPSSTPVTFQTSTRVFSTSESIPTTLSSDLITTTSGRTSATPRIESTLPTVSTTSASSLEHSTSRPPSTSLTGSVRPTSASQTSTEIDSTASSTTASSSSNARTTTVSVVIVSTTETTWLLGSPLSFSSPASTASLNGSTITHLFTSTATVQITTTVTAFDSALTFEPTIAARRKPFRQRPSTMRRRTKSSFENYTTML